MRYFKYSFSILSYSIVLLEMVLISFAIYSQIKICRQLHFETNRGESIRFSSEFQFIQFVDNLFWTAVIFWIIAAIIYFLIRRQLDNNLKIGILGCVLAVVYLIIDPFELYQYLVD